MKSKITLQERSSACENGSVGGLADNGYRSVHQFIRENGNIQCGLEELKDPTGTGNFGSQ